MQTRSWLFAAVLAFATPATAAPPTKVISVELDKEFGWRAFPELPASTAEPGGLLVPLDASHEWLEIGLRPGDLIRFINGAAAGERFSPDDGLYVIDLVRSGKPLVLHLMIHGAKTHTAKLDAEDYERLVDSTKRPPLSTPMLLDSKPSGVRVTDILLSLHLKLEIGDIVRTIGGQPIHTDDELIAAIRGLPVGSTKILVDHYERPVTIIVVREAAADLTQIRSTGKFAYQVPRAVAAAIAATPGLATRGAEVVPIVQNGKVHGQKVYAIAKDSLCAAIGLVDDDIVLDVEGHSLDSNLDAYQAASDLEAVDQLTLHVDRHGKRVDLTYTIK